MFFKLKIYNYLKCNKIIIYIKIKNDLFKTIMKILQKQFIENIKDFLKNFRKIMDKF